MEASNPGSPNPPEPGQTSNPETAPAPILSKTALICAVVVLALYLVLTVLLFVWAASAKQVVWTRYVYLYAGLEAVVFGAAGALFGTKVQRAETHKAEARAKDAEATASANRKAAGAGEALRKAIRAEVEASDDGEAGGGGLSTARVGSPGPGRAARDDGAEAESLRRLSNLADLLFDET